tara:strand:+ start:1426 stop:2355 length:930 start_codon:yes stop_codon:yes gene_type:complete
MPTFYGKIVKGATFNEIVDAKDVAGNITGSNIWVSSSDGIHGNINAEGDISASGTGSFGHLIIDGGNFTSASLAAGGGGSWIPTATSDLDMSTYTISASNISASSYISASEIIGATGITLGNVRKTSWPTGGGSGGGGIFVQESAGIYETSESITELKISASLKPSDDIQYDLGSRGNKWKAVYAQDTFFGGVHELNMTVPGLGKYPLGTILVWRNGTLVPCDSEADYMIMGVVKPPADSPVILGAEDVLVTGRVDEGDFIITSAKSGHGKAVKQNLIFKKDLFGKVIAQALESCDGESNLIRAMIRKM